MPTSSVPITLLGTRFSIQTDETPEYIKKLSDSLAERFSFIEETIGLKDPLKIAILACLFLEDELDKAKIPGSATLADLTEAEKLTQKIIEKLEDAL